MTHRHEPDAVLAPVMPGLTDPVLQQATLAAIQDAITTVDATGRILFANAAAANLMGFASVEEILSSPPGRLLAKFDIFDEDGRPMPLEAMPSRRVMRGEPTQETVIRWRHRDGGAERWSSAAAHPVRGPDGKVRAIVSVFREITGLKRAQAETLAERERRGRELRDFFENAAVPMHWVGADGTILWANHAELRLLGYAAEEYIGRNIGDFHLDPMVIGDILRRLGDRETLRERPARLRARDGSIREVLIDSNTYFEDGKFVHTRCVTRDVTARRQAERQLARRFNQVETVYRLSAVVASGDARGVHRAAFETLATTMGAARASILLFDRAGVMRFVAWEGLSEGYRAAVDGHSPWKQDAVDPQPVLVPDWKADDAWASYAATFEAEGVRALGFFPIVHRGRLLGKFMVYYDEPHEFTAEELQVARTIASHLAVATARQADDERLRFQAQALEAAGQAVVATDTKGTIVAWNRAAQSLFGHHVDEALGRNAEELTASASLHRRAREHVERLAPGEAWVGEVAERRKDGSEFPAFTSVGPVRGESGELLGTVAVTMDLSERKRAEESRARLAAIVENSDDAIVGKTLNGVITSWNRGAERIFGYTAHEVIGQSITILIPPECADEEKRIIASVTNGEPLEALETRRRRKDGTIIDVSLRVSPIRDDSGRIIGASKIARDITERKRAEDALRAMNERLQELDRLKTQFLNTVSHELRTPLTPMQLQLDVLAVRADSDPIRGKAVSVLDRNVRRLSRLVQEMVDVSRLQSGRLVLERQRLDLERCVAEAVESYDEPARLAKVDLRMPGHGPVPVSADLQRLHQVLSNLLANALKFTPAGGTITVDVVDVDGEPTVHVADSGIGLGPDQTARLFQPFSQVHSSTDRTRGGTGLGLFICRGIVEAHGGRIWVSSDGPGKGSRFSFTVPRRAEDEVSQGA